MTHEITWTNCADEMPPDDDTYVIAIVGDSKPDSVAGSLVRSEYLKWHHWSMVSVIWTPYTPEKWKGLNK